MVPVAPKKRIFFDVNGGVEVAAIATGNMMTFVNEGWSVYRLVLKLHGTFNSICEPLCLLFCWRKKWHVS
jgi:hypothetical protein